MNKTKDKTLLLLSFVGAAAFIFMNLIEVKPNRIVQGIRFSSLEYFGSLGLALLVFWLALLLLSFYQVKHKNMIIFILSYFYVLSLFFLLQLKTGDYTLGSTSTRISLSSGFYLQMFSIYMLFSTYTQRIEKNKFIKWMGFLSIFVLLSYLLFTGSFNEFSLLKEYNIKRSQFIYNLKVHAMLTFASVLTGVIIAVPLGFLAYSKSKHEDKIMLPLSIIETIPSLSLFAILLVPLSGLGKLSFFDALGVSGIGWAPAYIALSLYTLLPIARNALTGFHSVERDVIEAARGMGMNKNQILKKIEVPLAFPVIFTGIRIAFIQTIGGAVLAGLVGGGGMGTFIFLGLGEASPDLVLLGVLPIVFFTLVVDFILRAFEKTMRGIIYD